MKHFDLTAINDWVGWSHNSDIADLIYDTGLGKVNPGD